MSATGDPGFAPLPAHAAWRRHETDAGFEVVVVQHHADAAVVHGQTAFVDETGVPRAVRYELTLDADGTTRVATVVTRTAAGQQHCVLAHDGAGHWQVDGVTADDLEGCLDFDLAASLFTNAMPVRRFGLAVGAAADAPAAFLPADAEAVVRLEQRYERLPDAPATGDGAPLQRYAYAAPGFGFTTEITYDASGLVVAYPPLGSRAA